VVTAVGRAVAAPIAGQWPSRSRLFLVADSPRWVLAWEMREVSQLAKQLGIRVANPRLLAYTKDQSAFYASHFLLLSRDLSEHPHRLATTYFHGRPGSGEVEFDNAYRRFCLMHQHIDRVQVSHTEMRDVLLESGVAREKVFVIPIGINASYFPLRTPELHREARHRLGVPDAAVVVGSFQKVGVGWEEGLQPKLTKGPDVFLEAMTLLKSRLPGVFVLLSGPARGFVKRGLERLGIPYKHVFPDHYPDVAQLYQALDLYLVTSRQEGGPKAVLESMASGVPLVTTRVGQAMDLVRHGENAWMVEPGDVEGLAHWAEYAVRDASEAARVLACGRRTAEEHTYASQLPMWRRFFDGFVREESRT
jgi:glycosyltransferase involved in cell wall biosynthesis